LGILPTLEVILSMDDIGIKLASVDILTYVVEYSPSMVREYALQQDSSQDEVSLFLVSYLKRVF
jgi:protein phosphatase-4 regulatory subunit 3